MFNPSKEDVRRFFCDTWRKHREAKVLSPLEAVALDWMLKHPEYHGEFVNFDPIWQFPKPVQKPHPPILVGGDGENTLKRVVSYGDGWMPVGRRADFKSRIEAEPKTNKQLLLRLGHGWRRNARLAERLRVGERLAGIQDRTGDRRRQRHARARVTRAQPGASPRRSHHLRG